MLGRLKGLGCKPFAQVKEEPAPRAGDTEQKACTPIPLAFRQRLTGDVPLDDELGHKAHHAKGQA